MMKWIKDALPDLEKRMTMRGAIEAREKLASAFQTQLSTLQGLIPFEDRRVEIGLELVEYENKLADAKLEQTFLDVKLNDAQKARLTQINEESKKWREIQAIVEKLKTGKGDMEGFMAAWSYERLKESATTIYDTFKGLMGDMEKALSDAIYNAMTNKGNWSDIITGLGDAINKRIADMYAGMVFDSLASWGMKTFGTDIFAKMQQKGANPLNPLYVSVNELRGSELAKKLGGITGIEIPPHRAPRRRRRRRRRRTRRHSSSTAHASSAASPPSDHSTASSGSSPTPNASCAPRS